MLFCSRTVHDMNRADRGLKCDECESSFAKMAHLIRHKTSIHKSEVKPPPATDPEALEQQEESTLPASTVKKETPSEVKPSLPKISGKPQLCTECGEFMQQRFLVIQSAKFVSPFRSKRPYPLLCNHEHWIFPELKITIDFFQIFWSNMHSLM